ncbi:hypothetical protein D3C87_1673900 [compost metagenome]
MLFSLNQVHHQLFAQATVLRQKMHQTRLFQHHLGGHAHQLTVFAQRFRLTRQANYANDFPLQTQRQIDALAHAMQMPRDGSVNINDASLGKHQQRAFVQFTNTLPIAAADNSPTGIHYVDIGINDAHGSCHDFLRHFGIEMPASHVILP